ncbi:hypothetical protein D3C81_1751190 [compost metagenome]
MKYFRPQNSNQIPPSADMHRNAACQPQTCRISGSSIGVNIAPTLVPALKMPVATARSPAGNHRRVVFTQAG